MSNSNSGMPFQKHPSSPSRKKDWRRSCEAKRERSSVSDLPADAVRSLPRRQLPAAILAWFAIDQNHQGTGLGKRLFAAALRDCYQASETFAFVAILLNCIDESAKRFYQQFDLDELPGFPMRLFLSFKMLERMMRQ